MASALNAFGQRTSAMPPPALFLTFYPSQPSALRDFDETCGRSLTVVMNGNVEAVTAVTERLELRHIDVEFM
ncbi:hypothetical protein HPP92_000365 [Vanilla planifolia]|nr:hypothetical protein HPP92_000365 [Vanilla planifolia]